MDALGGYISRVRRHCQRGDSPSSRGGKTVEESSVFLFIFSVLVLSFDLFLLRRWYALFEPAELSFPIGEERFTIEMRFEAIQRSIGGK